MSEQSLKSKTVKGASWSTIDTVANQGITFLVGLILARLLTPEEYGLIGIIIIFISVFNNIVDSGFSNALIRKKDADNIDYSTGFFTNLAFSFFLFVVLFFAAPFIADFFHEEQLTSLLRVMGSIIIINAFAIIQRTILVKKVDFKTQTYVSLISSITSGGIGIGMALAGYGVWSLVGQQISRQFLNTLFLWVFNRWIPKFVFSVASFRGLWGFGWKLLVSSLINTIWNEIYQVVIGRCYTPVALGLYTRGYQFASIFSVNLNTVVQRVTYPVLSSIQDDKTRLKDGYKRIIKITMFVTFILMIGLVAVAEPMVRCLIGDQWIGCVPMLQLISLTTMLYPLHSLNLNMLQVQGRSDLFLKLEIMKKTIAVIPLLLGIFVGIYWMLISSVFSSIASYYLNAFYSGKFLNYSMLEQVRDILPSFVIAIVMAIPVYLLSYIPASSFIVFPLQLLVGFILVLLICEKMKVYEYFEIKNNVVVPILNKIKK